MMNIICDCCKKAVPNASRGRNYFTYLNKAVCYSCKEELELAVRKEMFRKPSYTYDTYQKVFTAKLNELCK